MSDTVEMTLVSPVYLSGRGDPGWVTVPLHRASGWSYGHDPLMPRVLLASPKQQATLRIDPDPDEPWWTIRNTRTDDQPAWKATFDAHTPVEIIAAFTDALTNPRALHAATPPPLLCGRQAGVTTSARAASCRPTAWSVSSTSPNTASTTGSLRSPTAAPLTTSCGARAWMAPRRPIWSPP